MTERTKPARKMQKRKGKRDNSKREVLFYVESDSEYGQGDVGGNTMVADGQNIGDMTVGIVAEEVPVGRVAVEIASIVKSGDVDMDIGGLEAVEVFVPETAEDGVREIPEKQESTAVLSYQTGVGDVDGVHRESEDNRAVYPEAESDENVHRNGEEKIDVASQGKYTCDVDPRF